MLSKKLDTIAGTNAVTIAAGAFPDMVIMAYRSLVRADAIIAAGFDVGVTVAVMAAADTEFGSKYASGRMTTARFAT